MKLWCEWGIWFWTINTNNANLNLYFGATTSLPPHRRCLIFLLNKVDDHDCYTQVRVVSNTKDLFKFFVNFNWRLLCKNETGITGVENLASNPGIQSKLTILRLCWKEKKLNQNKKCTCGGWRHNGFADLRCLCSCRRQNRAELINILQVDIKLNGITNTKPACKRGW